MIEYECSREALTMDRDWMGASAASNCSWNMNSCNQLASL